MGVILKKDLLVIQALSTQVLAAIILVEEIGSVVDAFIRTLCLSIATDIKEHREVIRCGLCALLLDHVL
jgi:hypothetical protein